MKTLSSIPTNFVIAAVAAIALLATPNQTRAAEATPPKATKLAPSWELQSVEGKAVSSANYSNQVVVLVFWATWCPPCRAEIPGFIDLQKKYAKQGLAIVSVSVDQASADTVKSFAKKNGINYPVLVSDAKMEAAFGGISSLPTTFIINRAGNIVKQHVGFAEKSELEAEIKPLLQP